jgi:subtilase family serine protease
VTGVPDGDYILETLADPDDAIREANESNNCASVFVRLSGMDSTAPEVGAPRCGPAVPRP